jgi:hypothetical protein
MDLTPKEIYRDLKNKNINQITAYNLLISLVENSENENIRLESILNLEKIGLISDNLYNFLENLLISDSNRRIRNAAAQFLENKFLEKAINPLKWAIKHETDYECLITISQTLEKINTPESKLILINEIKKIIKTKYLNKERKIDNKKFKSVIKKLIKNKKVDFFNHTELAEILINYLTISNLTKQYLNVYFELDSQNGLIRELDLSDYLEHEVKGTPFGWKNNIKSISEIIGLNHLKYLKKIDLSNNQIEDVKDLIHLENLTHLILINNKISKRENLNYLKCLSNLEYLDLRGNELGKFINVHEFDPKIRVLLKFSYI